MMSFLEGISFNIKYHRIYTKAKYKRLIRLVAITHNSLNMVSDRIIEKTTVKLAINETLKKLIL